MHSILHLHFLETLSFNALFIPGLLIFFYNLLIKALQKIHPEKEINNMVYHPKFPIIVLITVLAFWLFRNIPVYPFTILAP
ncbi:hypothetical protein [Neptunitalea lumnitzerae]|uniref:hypothetical protein n=1 Tax=Neptunitalea lumnitzerae TaxID=2965509 RepID=UPI0038CD62EB